MINNRSYISNGFKTECRRLKNLFDNDIKVHRDRLEVAILDSLDKNSLDQSEQARI